MQQILFFSMAYFIGSAASLPIALWFCSSSLIYRVDWHLMLLGASSPISVSWEIDKISFLFCFVVLFISANVSLFSVGYLEGEPHLSRFSYLLFFFILSMMTMIFSGNLITVLLGWDGLGLTSFLLVIFYRNSYSLGAGLITLLTNRLGDVMLLCSLTFILSGSLAPILVPLFLVLGAITKSAQFPFSSWLPMAMAAPTPVSSLVHSSTLVTAGVFLIIRFFQYVGSSSEILSLLMFVSSLTMILAGLAALVEVDFKKIIAYSTLSQLGVMVFALSLGSWDLSLLHLLSHAMFKALMFVCAGIYIYHHGHGQDLRALGALSHHLPFTHLGLLISNLSLCGFPFLSGFYSKDPIYEMGSGGLFSFTSLVFMSVGLFLTSAYSLRAFFMSQVSSRNQVALSSLSNTSLSFTLPVCGLSLFSLVWGCSLFWVLLPPTIIGPMSAAFGAVPLFSMLLASAYMGVFCVSEDFYSESSSVGFFSLFKLEALSKIGFLSFMSSQYLIAEVSCAGKSFLQVVDNGWVEAFSAEGSKELVSGAVQFTFKMVNEHLIGAAQLGVFAFFLISLV